MLYLLETEVTMKTAQFIKPLAANVSDTSAYFWCTRWLYGLHNNNSSMQNAALSYSCSCKYISHSSSHASESLMCLQHVYQQNTFARDVKQPIRWCKRGKNTQRHDYEIPWHFPNSLLLVYPSYGYRRIYRFLFIVLILILCCLIVILNDDDIQYCKYNSTEMFTLILIRSESKPAPQQQSDDIRTFKSFVIKSTSYTTSTLSATFHQKTLWLQEPNLHRPFNKACSPSLELWLLHLDLIYCYRIVFRLIKLNFSDFF